MEGARAGRASLACGTPARAQTRSRRGRIQEQARRRRAKEQRRVDEGADPCARQISGTPCRHDHPPQGHKQPGQGETTSPGPALTSSSTTGPPLVLLTCSTAPITSSPPHLHRVQASLSLCNCSSGRAYWHWRPPLHMPTTYIKTRSPTIAGHLSCTKTCSCSTARRARQPPAQPQWPRSPLDTVRMPQVSSTEAMSKQWRRQRTPRRR